MKHSRSLCLQHTAETENGRLGGGGFEVSSVCRLVLPVSRTLGVFCGGMPQRCGRPMLWRCSASAARRHRLSVCCCADRTHGHTQERAAGVVYQLAPPDEGLRVMFGAGMTE